MASPAENRNGQQNGQQITLLYTFLHGDRYHHMFRHESKFQLYRPPAFSFWIGPRGLVCRWIRWKVQLSFSMFFPKVSIGLCLRCKIWSILRFFDQMTSLEKEELSIKCLHAWRLKRRNCIKCFHILSLCTVLAQHIPIPRSIRKPFYHKGWGLQRSSPVDDTVANWASWAQLSPLLSSCFNMLKLLISY